MMKPFSLDLPTHMDTDLQCRPTGSSATLATDSPQLELIKQLLL